MLIKLCRLAMDRGYRKVNILKLCAELFLQNWNDDIFGAEMVGVYEIYAELLCVKKAVIFNVGCNIRIATETFGKCDAVAARATHDGKLFYRPPGIVITQSVYMECFFACPQKALKINAFG